MNASERRIHELLLKNRELRRARFVLIIIVVLSYLVILYLGFAYDMKANSLRNAPTVDPDTIQQNQKITKKPEPPIEFIEYKEPVIVDYQIFEVTGYCACVKCTGSGDGITKSGQPVQINKTIAMDKSYAMGTEVIIEGFDGIVFEKQDIGGAITNNKIDIYFKTHQEALNFGRRQLKVWILPTEVTEDMQMVFQ